MTRSFSITIILLYLSACTIIPVQPENTLQNIPLELTTHLGYQQSLVEGDEIQLLLSLGADAYIYMYYINSNGKLQTLLPSTEQVGHYYSAGYFLTIPNYKNAYRFIIKPPFGQSAIWVLASDQSVKLNNNENTIEMIKDKIKASSTNGYGEYVLNIKTKKITKQNNSNQ